MNFQRPCLHLFRVWTLMYQHKALPEISYFSSLERKK